MSSGFNTAIVAGLALLPFGCSQEKSKPMLEFMPNMAHSPAVKAQERPMFLPVAGTVPRDWEAYPYGVGDTLKAAAELSNPMPMTMDVLEAGRKSFNTFCIVCHGAKGDGKGYIIPKFPQPPSLLTDRIKRFRRLPRKIPSRWPHRTANAPRPGHYRLREAASAARSAFIWRTSIGRIARIGQRSRPTRT